MSCEFVKRPWRRPAPVVHEASGGLDLHPGRGPVRRLPNSRCSNEDPAKSRLESKRIVNEEAVLFLVHRLMY